ncbi:uncharacterized protein LOC123792459 [Ursus americanus]|uniref:uncharacterized protein LOC123792459 n=1 Tax=Ursus americanus TaxID=9643 RepID=UPI001E67D91A|nr:uncharacterized protein LOC123792459 [Ursus americanus]
MPLENKKGIRGTGWVLTCARQSYHASVAVCHDKEGKEGHWRTSCGTVSFSVHTIRGAQGEQPHHLEADQQSAVSTRKPCQTEIQTSIQRNTCTPAFIAALFTIAKLWKQPSVHRWMTGSEEENRRGAGISSVLDGTRQKLLSGIPILTYSTFSSAQRVWNQPLADRRNRAAICESRERNGGHKSSLQRAKPISTTEERPRSDSQR